MHNEPDTIVAVLHECTTNTPSGNPRRCFTAIGGTGHILRVTDEGYAGRPDWVRDLADQGVWDVRVDVTIGHYKDRIRLGLTLDAGNKALRA